MAAGFKQATVNAADVPSSQTNYPAYVDLSRVGITTLAEAQSVRCYSDSAKTTELAREIVSASEMHVKIPTLTSTFVLYIDYDGVRSDYAVTDTYGRNAVWTGFQIVLHAESALTDSTGNRTMGQTGTVAYASAQIGNGFSIPDTANYPTAPDANDIDYTGNMYYSAWLRRNDAGNRDSPFSKGSPWTDGTGYWMHFDSSNNVVINRPATSYSNLSLGTLDITTERKLFAYKKTAATNMKIYSNGSLLNTVTTNATGAFTANTASLRIGNRTDSDDLWDGTMDEVRFSSTLPSDDWLLIDYNNQSDEPGFWGTWTDAGGTTYTSQLMMMGMG